jgi:hypothetical protein
MNPVREDIVTHEEQLVSDLISAARPMLAGYMKLQPRERRLRLNGLQQILDALMPMLEAALFQELVAWVSVQAEDVAGTCAICSIAPSSSVGPTPSARRPSSFSATADRRIERR